MINREAEVEAFLEHFGVKGMKWGVRKTPAQKQKTAREKRLGQRQLKSEAKLQGLRIKAATVDEWLLGRD